MKNNNKQIMYSIIGIAILIISVVGLSFAFFNYTRTGAANTLKTGNISFNSTQDNTISLTNVFPTSSNSLNSTISDTVTINITGDTTYSEGIEYKVTLDQVNNTINNKEVPISIRATATNLGTEDSSYYTNRTNKTKIYMLNSEGEAYNGKYIAVGYIPAGTTGVDGSIDITAFIDTNKVAISDTYDGTESDLMGTTNDWVMGREVFTTTEWNSFDSVNPLSFKVKVEANEGIWVEKEKFLTMKNIFNDSNWSSIRANVTSIEFHKDGIAPSNYVTSFDVTDETSDSSKGNITLYTVDDGLGNNTYKAIVVANDIIYAPENSTALFRKMSKLTYFNSKNFNVDNVVYMNNMFRQNINLTNVDGLINWNTSNVEGMIAMFYGCTNLTNVDGLRNWNVENVIGSDVLGISGIFSMFQDCTNLTNIDGLRNWNVENVTSFQAMFSHCTNLENASGINDWNVNSEAVFVGMFAYTPVHPEFTKFPNGTWSNGTFTPNA